MDTIAKMGAAQHIYSEVAGPMRMWQRLGDTVPLEVKIAELSRDGYTLLQIAAGARMLMQTVRNMKRRGDVHLQRQTEREIRDMLVFEE